MRHGKHSHGVLDDNVHPTTFLLQSLCSTVPLAVMKHQLIMTCCYLPIVQQKGRDWAFSRSRAVPVKGHAQQLLITSAGWQAQVCNEGQRNAEQGPYETLVQERVSRLLAGVCYDPVVPAKIPAPETAHVL